MKPTSLLIAAAAVLLAGGAADAQSVDAALNEHAMFGINRTTGELLRYDFADQQLTNIGPVRDGNGSVYTGIDASAYIPGFQNIFVFHQDTGSGQSRLLYVDTQTAVGTVVGQELGAGPITGAVTAWVHDPDGGDADRGHGNDCSGYDPDNPGASTGVNENGQGRGAHGGTCDSRWFVFAVQQVNGSGGANVNFDVNGGRVVPNEEFTARITVLGAAISAGGAYDVPVTMSVQIGNTVLEPFGSYASPTGGNVNDAANPREYVLPGLYTAGTPVSIRGRSWIKKSSRYSGTSDAHWQSYLIVDSNSNSPNVLALRNGDPVPDIQPFMNQNAIVEFVRDYVDPNTGTVSLDANQVIYLFELGTQNLNSAAADFQDLVVLVTLAKNASELTDTSSNRLLRIDHQTGASTQLMTLSRSYDGLASLDGVSFYATAGDNLYRLDTAAQTETLIGSLTGPDMFGLEFCDSFLMGFEIVGDQLMPVDPASGTPLAAPADLGMVDLGTIIFMPVESDPAATPEAYD